MMVERGIYPYTSSAVHAHEPTRKSMTKATDSPQPPEALSRWYTRYASPVGTLYIATRADALVGIWYEDQAHFPLPHELGELIENPVTYLREHGAAEGEEPADEYAAAQLLSRAEVELSEYFERKRTSFTLPLDPEGTDFQLIVWEHLKTVPAGYTTTYGDISRAVGPVPPRRRWVRRLAVTKFPL